MTKGKFVVIYGANNLGKSTQVDMLVQSLRDKNIPVKKLKYPLYDLKPTGPEINAILRQGKKVPEIEVQKLYAQNRRDFQPELQKLLDQGTWIVAEDYTGTGIAWGMVRGLEVEELEKINEDLLKEDLAIMLEGERFKHSIEKGHRNEQDDLVWQNGQEKHQFLAKRYGWEKVNANQTKNQVHQEIIAILNKKGII